MQSQLYVAYSAQLALQRRLDTIADNMANVSTVGYRGQEVSFEQLISNTNNDAVSFASLGESHISLHSGEIQKTGNPLDVAVRGNAWLAIETADGVAYTRDGRMTMAPSGQLTTVSGFPILDSSQSPIQIDPNLPPPQIAADGTITQGAHRAGAIGLFTIPRDTPLARGAGTSVLTNGEVVAELDFNNNGLSQGFVERSNVNPMEQLSRLITLQRTFEAVTSTIRDSELALQDATRNLSGTS